MTETNQPQNGKQLFAVRVVVDPKTLRGRDIDIKLTDIETRKEYKLPDFDYKVLFNLDIRSGKLALGEEDFTATVTVYIYDPEAKNAKELQERMHHWVPEVGWQEHKALINGDNIKVTEIVDGNVPYEYKYDILKWPKDPMSAC